MASYGILVQSFNEGAVQMPRKSPFCIELSPEESGELIRRATKYTLPYFEVVRAKMILMAADGMDNDQIAARLDTRREVVSQWRKRFFKKRRCAAYASPSAIGYGTRPGPRKLAQPDRNLLLDRAAQGAGPERLPLPESGRRAAGQLRALL